MKIAYLLSSIILTLVVMPPVLAERNEGHGTFLAQNGGTQTTTGATTTKKQQSAKATAHGASKPVAGATVTATKSGTIGTTTTSTTSGQSASSGTKLQGGVKRAGKFKTSAAPTAARNSYSLTQPYNPNNPPPIDNKIHPVSSNAR